MNFTNTDAFFLLLLLPIFARIGWPRHTYRKRRDTIALGIRLVLIIVLILSLSGLEIKRQADKLAVVFLIDVSDSMDGQSQREAVDYVRASVESMGDNDQAAVVLFGSNALVEHPMDEILNLSQIGSNPIPIHTDLSEAIRLGLALFPPDTAKRMVILSDGLETIGDAERAAELAAATGVQIDYIPFGTARNQEVLVSSVSVPSRVSENEPFDLIISIENQSDTPTTAELFIFAGGASIIEETITIDPGTRVYSFGPLQYPDAGFIDFQVEINPLTAEGFTQNNHLSAFTQISGRPQILVVSSEPDNPEARETEFLEAALTAEDAGFLIDHRTPEEVPLSLARLQSYSAIILANVNAADLTPARMNLIEQYVRDQGGGLVVIGGDESYGVGGYFETPLEDTLPVEMRIRDQERVPQLAMIYVIDRSGSMEITGPSGFTNLELAKEAIIRSFNLLNEYDRAGVISFDHQAFWVVDVQEIGSNANRQQLEDTVASLRPGGGTDIYGGLSAVSQELEDPNSLLTTATLKHVILLTDGGANPSGIDGLVRRMNNNYDVTMSVVAVGNEYAPWLRGVTSSAGGQFHVATTVESIPAIFSAETVLATRSYIFEEPFVPVQTAPSPIMDHINAQSMPPLLGYIATTPKDTATVILSGPEEDPILASWQYGLGRSVAFTSDATLHWGTNWVQSWAGYSAFWNQVVHWTITEGTDSQMDAWVDSRGEQSVVVVDARDDDGNYLNGLDLDVAVTYPNGGEPVLPEFRQVAPGRYEAIFEPTEEGAYFIGIVGRTEEDAPVQATVRQNIGWVLSYSDEYRVSQPNPANLRRISNKTNGGQLERQPDSAFVHNLDQEEAALPMWPYLVALAGFLLIADIAVRRLVINRSDLEKARETVAGVFRRKASTYDETLASERLSGLMAAKQRAGATVDVESGGTVATSSAPSMSKPPSRPSPTPHATQKPSTPAPTPSKPRPQPISPPADGSVASRLLKKKRDRGDS